MKSKAKGIVDKHIINYFTTILINIRINKDIFDA